MDLRQLRYFVGIVDSGSLTKASRLLCIAQPALSQQLSKLEAEVGRMLLHRSARGVAPTGNGLALYHHARFMLRQQEQALTIARQDGGELRGMVSLGLPATTLHAMGLPLVRQVRSLHPGVLLNVVEGTAGSLAQMMRQGELDLAVQFDLDAFPQGRAVALLDEELFLLLPEASDLVGPARETLTLEEVARLPLILPTGSHGLRRRVGAEFDRRGLVANVVAEIDSFTLLMDCVRDGLGATLQPMSAVSQAGRTAPGWRALRIADVRISRRNYLSTARQEDAPRAAVAVASALRDVAAALVRSGQWQGATLPS
ncbi:LysR substrate-binding domain-containing protein [Ramlibacter sp.]|uniref:LysR substrate-binding domain-containing protein n=1 Tax=Ramlibacter sp. TaxID=1917967 RepID=UPI002FC7449A